MIDAEAAGKLTPAEVERIDQLWERWGKKEVEHGQAKS